MIKISACLIIIFSCTSLGFLRAAEFEKRVKILVHLKADLDFIKNEISFMRSPAEDIFKKAVRRESELSFFYDSVCKRISEGKNKGISEILCEEARGLKAVLPLSEDDIDILLLLGQCFGKSDVDGQISAIKTADKSVDAQICAAKDTAKKNSRLCKGLGFYGGILIVIMFF